jgi:hypothetical protein
MSGQPSTAFIDPVTHQYVPCPTNQPLAYQDRSAHDLGQREHITQVQGYCKHGVLGGCPKDGE